MAVLGDQLLQPEEGWKRIDDTDPMFTYVGNGWNRVSSTDSYNGSYQQTWHSSTIPSRVEFSFRGEALRIIGSTYSNGNGDGELKVTIDGKEFSASSIGDSYQTRVVIFEALNLSPSKHTISIEKQVNSKILDFDAIDIISTPLKIGDQLVQPEEGWQRFDNKNSLLKYNGNWQTYSVGSNNFYYYQNEHAYTKNDSSASLTVKFKGSKMRLIAQAGNRRTTDVKVTVDGIEEESMNQFAAGGSPTVVDGESMVIMYERVFGDAGEHTIVFTNRNVDAEFAVDAIDIGVDDILLAPPRDIGYILKTPDPGWKRIDDSDKRIMYGGAWNTYTGTAYSGGTIHESRTIGTTVEFSFLGTKFRIISFRDSAGYRADDIKISVDGGPTEIYSEVGNRGDQSALVYQKERMEYGYHTVRITSGTVSAYKMYLDAIDIEETAEFFSPLPATTGTLKSKVSEMEIGDYIICAMYVNPFRQLQYLGDKDTINSGLYNVAIPFANGGLKYSTSALVRGHFYLVKVDKGLLVADRIVFSGQNATWSSLKNSSGRDPDSNSIIQDLIDGSSFDKGPVNFTSEEVPGDFKNIKGIVRSLTGGIAYRDKYGNIRTSNDKYGAYPANNEWDKYIKNFPSDMIKEGYSLNDVFHCVRDDKDAPLYTICRETPYLGVPNINGAAATASDRTMRTEWLSGDSGFSHLSATNGDYSGFRPVIEYEE
jgi:hypothetical protein